MKFSRRIPRPSRLLGWMSLPLLVCGVFCIALSWTYILISLPPSMRTIPETSSLPMSAMGDDSQRSISWEVLTPRPLHPSHVDAVAEQYGQNEFVVNLSNRHLSSTADDTTGGNLATGPRINNDEDHLFILTPTTKTQPEVQSFQLNHTAPLTSLIYPLHAKSGTHHAYLYIGTPPQRQTLIVDTGSRLTAFPCHPHCSDCGMHASEPFHLNESSSHSIVPCEECRLNQVDFQLEKYFSGDGVGGNSGDRRYRLRGTKNNVADKRRHDASPNSCITNQCKIDQKYTEGSSWKAFEVKDRVWLGSDEAVTSAEEHDEFATPFVFGCQVSEKGLFKSQYADGIMGLSMYTQMLVSEFARHGSISHKSFSLCLNREGGHISLGGTGMSYDHPSEPEQLLAKGGRHLAPMKFTPFRKLDVWYYTVHVTSISVGAEVLPNSILRFINDYKGTIVDSGTTDTFISHKVEKVSRLTSFLIFVGSFHTLTTEPAQKAFTSAWETITGRSYNNRLQKYTHQQFNELPVITFELQGGVLWEIKPEAYMEADYDRNGNETANRYDANIPWEGKRKFTSRIYLDEPAGVVLGSNAMMDKEIYFDVANKMLGVAKATCKY